MTRPDSTVAVTASRESEQTIAVELRGISASYGDVPALTDVSLSVPAGETAAILGPNGAGKTSLLRRLSALPDPRGGGEIILFGENVSKMPPHRIVERGLVQVPENRQIFGSLTVAENLEIGAHLKAARKGSRQQRDEVYQLFPILKSRNRQIAGTLSGGEQQMLAIGRALMSRPKVLLLDEPSLGIAPAVVEELFAGLAELRERGITLILAEQNAVQALELATQASVLSLGRLTLSGPTADVLRDPQIQRSYLGVDTSAGEEDQ